MSGQAFGDVRFFGGSDFPTDLDKAIRATEGAYNLGYYSDLSKVKKLDKFVDVSVKCLRKNCKISARDGFYSFEAERQGAAEVLATDSWTWNWPDSDARGNFELARDTLGSRVRTQDITVEDLDPETVGGPFDLVLFLGVLYHAPDPLGYLRRVRSVTGGMAIIETVVDLLDHELPAIAYYPGGSLNDDASNHFGPNPQAVEGLLSDAGFGRVVSFDPWQTSPDWAVHAGSKRRRTALNRLRRRLRRPRSGRMVFHAYA